MQESAGAHPALPVEFSRFRQQLPSAGTAGPFGGCRTSPGLPLAFPLIGGH